MTGLAPSVLLLKCDLSATVDEKSNKIDAQPNIDVEGIIRSPMSTSIIQICLILFLAQDIAGDLPKALVNLI